MLLAYHIWFKKKNDHWNVVPPLRKSMHDVYWARTRVLFGAANFGHTDWSMCLSAAVCYVEFNVNVGLLLILFCVFEIIFDWSGFSNFGDLVCTSASGCLLCSLSPRSPSSAFFLFSLVRMSFPGVPSCSEIAIFGDFCWIVSSLCPNKHAYKFRWFRFSKKKFADPSFLPPPPCSPAFPLFPLDPFLFASLSAPG